jgi:hypothetical protein
MGCRPCTHTEEEFFHPFNADRGGVLPHDHRPNHAQAAHEHLREQALGLPSTTI